ncbi:MAG: dihydroorotase [Cycloclasticus sp. symbiont of Poecilosclerida sp. M]|nr:MAG: dihydroorotase [Cycloclasticus sp. symbiont of Poecilosclerida sp. M]
MNILIKNGRVIDPRNGLDTVQDVYIADGKIQSIGKVPKGFTAKKTIDAKNKVLAPGFIDLNTRLREPGFEFKATIASETKAAAAAGFTHICCLPDTMPVIDTPAVANLIQDKAQAAGFSKVLPIGALTVDLQGEILTEAYALQQAGCVALSQAPNTIAPHTLRRALQYASTFGMLVVLKAEDAAIRDDGCIHAGEISSRLGLQGIPASAETVAVAQIIALADETGARVHLTGISTAKAVSMLARAQKDGIKISADAHAHQMHLTDKAVETFDANYHVSPPLRSTSDKKALIKGLEKGVIQISSGHEPHEAEAKQAPFPSTQAGISSLETALPLTLGLVAAKSLTLSQAISRLSFGPAEILGIDAGHLSIGAEANLCIFDADETWKVNQQNWLSRGLNTPFMGDKMTGRVTHTLIDGKVVYEQG